MLDLARLREVEEQRQNWLRRDVDSESDEDDAPPPLNADQMVADMDDIGLHTCSNLTAVEFEAAWTIVQGSVIGLCQGGVHSRLTPRSWFLVTLMWCKYGMPWT